MALNKKTVQLLAALLKNQFLIGDEILFKLDQTYYNECYTNNDTC